MKKIKLLFVCDFAQNRSKYFADYFTKNKLKKKVEAKYCGLNILADIKFSKRLFR